MALDRSMDSRSVVTSGKTECVSIDAGGWIDVVVGDCQFSSSCFNILNEAGSKLYSHTVYLQTCSWSESLPLVCAHSCRHILVHTRTTCILFLCLSKAYLGFRVQLRLHLLGWAFPHPYCLKYLSLSLLFPKLQFRCIIWHLLFNPQLVIIFPCMHFLSPSRLETLCGLD